MTMTATGWERIAGAVAEPHRSRCLLIAALRRVEAKGRALERRRSPIAHERTRQRGTGTVRYVVHLAGCPLARAARPGLPAVSRPRLEQLRDVYLCQRCKPELGYVLAEHDRR